MVGLLVETEEQHAHYDGSAPAHRWTDWYAAYVVARHDGPQAEEAAADAGRHVEAL
jgi:hypothetical protein